MITGPDGGAAPSISVAIPAIVGNGSGGALRIRPSVQYDWTWVAWRPSIEITTASLLGCAKTVEGINPATATIPAAIDSRLR